MAAPQDKLSNQEIHFIGDLMDIGKQMRELRNRMLELRARYDQNGFAVSIAQAHLDAYGGDFEHLTTAKIVNGITANQAVIDALGDASSGQLVNLIKLMP